jgi:hypothetical protein
MLQTWWKIAHLLLRIYVENVEKNWCLGSIVGNQFCFLLMLLLMLMDWAISHISKKHFRLGGLPASEWTCSIRAVTDTPVADYSAPGVDTTCQIAYRPPIAVSPFLLALSVSYFKYTLWLCGQL